MYIIIEKFRKGGKESKIKIKPPLVSKKYKPTSFQKDTGANVVGWAGCEHLQDQLFRMRNFS